MITRSWNDRHVGRSRGQLVRIFSRLWMLVISLKFSERNWGWLFTCWELTRCISSYHDDRKSDVLWSSIYWKNERVREACDRSLIGQRTHQIFCSLTPVSHEPSDYLSMISVEQDKVIERDEEFRPLSLSVLIGRMYCNQSINKLHSVSVFLAITCVQRLLWIRIRRSSRVDGRWFDLCSRIDANSTFSVPQHTSLMVNTRSSHPNGEPTSKDSYKDRHIKVGSSPRLNSSVWSSRSRKSSTMNMTLPMIRSAIRKVHRIIT